MVDIAINGMGRIGRCVLRESLNDPDINIVGLNDLTDKKRLAYHLQYDSVHGELDSDVGHNDRSITIDDREIPVTHEEQPVDLSWDDADVVIEATGVFRHPEDARQHLDAGADKVLISAPAKGPNADDVPSIVYGVNNDDYRGHDIVDCASCTTNSVAPLVNVLHDEFGIESGLLTTVHAYTGSQKIVDAASSKIRRGRAAAENIVPTTTGAADAVTDVLPELEGLLDGMAMRVPTPNGSITDLTVTLNDDADRDAVNQAFKRASRGRLEGVLGYSDDPLVSRDIIGRKESSIVDSPSTCATLGQVKVLGWYDNEYGYACRMLDVAKML
jgi:glyceraldehyde 3-phosphate dehydrogenase